MNQIIIILNENNNIINIQLKKIDTTLIPNQIIESLLKSLEKTMKFSNINSIEDYKNVNIKLGNHINKIIENVIKKDQKTNIRKNIFKKKLNKIIVKLLDFIIVKNQKTNEILYTLPYYILMTSLFKSVYYRNQSNNLRFETDSLNIDELIHILQNTRFYFNIEKRVNNNIQLKIDNFLFIINGMEYDLESSQKLIQTLKQNKNEINKLFSQIGNGLKTKKRKVKKLRKTKNQKLNEYIYFK
jgi:hypothetical protein